MITRHFLLIILVLGLPCLGHAAEDSGWWTPFANDLTDAMRDNGPWATARDGEFGADLLWLHEPGATSHVRFVRDGMPYGTGHRWSDDPWLVEMAGTRLSHITTGGVGAHDAGGSVILSSVPADTIGALLDTNFFKGRDESYLRRLAFRTGRAPWTLRFEFDEQILYDLSGATSTGDPTEYPEYYSPAGDDRDWGIHAGESKNRVSRLALVRRLDDGSRFDLSYARARKHKTTLPAFDLERHEYWTERLHASWSGDVGQGHLRVGTASNGTDMVTSPRDETDHRTIETVRHQVVIEATGLIPDWDLDVELGTWRLVDNGPLGEWLGQTPDPVREGGQDVDATLRRQWHLGHTVWTPHAGVGWTHHSGARPEVGLAATQGPWILNLGMGGRAPRSDEIATAWTVYGPGEKYRLLPNEDLTWERTTRASLGWSGSVAGWTLGSQTVYRRLRDGIGWSRQDGLIGDGTEQVGMWQNGLEVNGWATTFKTSRRGYFLGRYQLEAQMSARGYDIPSGTDGPLPTSLPPELSAAATVRWQHPYFHGDGIWELAWTIEHRGAMPDPWLPGTATTIEAATLHHAMVVFRLTGVDLGFDIRNVLDQNVPLSAGALSRGREVRMRLEWALRQ